MKESFVNGVGAIVANDQTTKVAEPGEGAFYFPTAAIAAQGPAVLGTRLAAIAAMRRDQLDPSLCQSRAQRIAVVGAVGNHALRLLAWASSAMPPAHADRRERFFREPNFVGGRRVKLLSRGIPWPSTTTIHFVPLPRLVFPTFEPLFSPVRNCRPETPRSSRVARVAAVPPGMRAKW